MERYISVILVGCLIGMAPSCTRTISTSARHPSAIAQEIKSVLRETTKVCPPTTVDGKRVVVCPIEQFRKVGQVCIGCRRVLMKEQAENRALRSTGALDLQAEQARAAELQRRLDSPWRSWWLWALIGAAAAGAVLTGVYWGAEPRSQAPRDFIPALPDMHMY